MARKVTIDVEARFVDNLTDDAKKAEKVIDKLDKKEAEPEINADNKGFMKKIQAAEDRAKKFGNTKTAAVLSVVDKASSVLAKVSGEAKSFANKVFTGIVKVKDIATNVLSKVMGLGKTIAGSTWSAIVKVKDMATAPLKKIKDSLFSLKTLIGTVVAGAAVQQVAKNAVAQPVSLADSIESSRIAFESKLGSAKAAESFLQDIYKFDEKSPFDTMEIVGITQQMMNLGWTAKNVLDDLGVIGDWSASLGKGEEGISAVTRALGQMRMKGKLSSEEMLQLTEAGVDAWNYVAKYMGKDIQTIREMAEDGAIDVDTAIKAIITGMGEYTGSAAALADRTVSGLSDQIKALFNTYVKLPWGEGLSEGFKDALVNVRDIIDENKDSLKAFGETAKEVGRNISGWFADRVENAVTRVKDIMGSDEFQNAGIGEKVSMLWDGVIANPFAAWWNETVVPWWDSTVVPWLAEKAAVIGRGISSGLTNGLLALLGFDASGAVEDGKTIGGSFVEGFLDGFDTGKITDALKNWASENKELATSLGVFVGGKLLSGLGGALGNIMTLFGKGSGGGSGLGSSSVGTMTVNAAVVNINGATGGGLPSGSNGNLPAGTGAGTPKVGFFGRMFGSTGNAMVNGSGLLGKLASAGYGLTGGAAGSALSGGAAAAIGGGSILGGVLGAVGIGDGIIDFVDASKAAKGSKARKDKLFQGGTKLAMVGGGAGAGAAAGAAIGAAFGGVGAVPGALIGAGIGGLGALFGGDKAGKALSDSTDEGGALNNAWKATRGFFTETIPEKAGAAKDKASGWLKKKYYGDAYDEETGQVDMGWMGDTGGWIDKVNAVKTFFTETIPNAFDGFVDSVSGFFTETVPGAAKKAGEGISKFFTETIPQKWGEFWDGVSSFFTETIPTALAPAGEAISKFFTETIPEKWNEFWEGVGTFFSETVPYALGYATGKVYAFFTETVPQFFSDLWDSLAAFFTETLPDWADNIWNGHVVPFFTETIPQFFSDIWDSIATFFTETLPDWAEGIWNNHVLPFFTETLPGFFSDLWDSITTFFTETLPDWAEGIWNDHVLPFFTETLPGFFAELWDSIATFFGETLPDWAEGIWNDHVLPFFTETLPGFFGMLWDSISTFFGETLPEWAEGIWNDHILPFFTETLPGFFGMLWDSISTFFTETIPEWADTIWNNNIVPFFTETIPGFFGTLWDSVTTFWNDSIDWIAESIWSPISTFFTETVPGWISSLWDKVTGWWDGVKDSFTAGFEAGSGGGSGGGGKARGGIVGWYSSMDAFARGGRTDGGIVGGSTRFIRVNEESPEMIIPLSRQRRDRAMKLWQKTGEIIGADRFFRGGPSDENQDRDDGFRWDNPFESSGSNAGVNVDVGGVHVEIKVEAAGSENIVEAIKAQGQEIAETVAGILADAFQSQFENTPTKGGVA